MFSHATPSVYESSRNLDFITSVEIILPQSAFNEVYTKLVQGNDAPKFERISMSLHDLLTGDFLQYIRSGDTMMLSEGRIGIDNVFCLKDGSLKMFLDKEAYERAGLVGKPHGPKGNRGLKSRWVVEIDLQVKSMTPGKKGFQRLVQASKNALVTPTTWMVLVSENDPR
ncbi:hypothetical protein P8C59_006769 [Phyllachora maydis]|uniref:Uncharacterized protein n=1 Tax=Phyllachora maydis TaxID=1825666 RepID=A0AAD9I8S1_9PEZI|nr:hypothetical protein P8C59_006769 [Phyllachora maydis]